MRGTNGVVAAGHEITAQAAISILREGGNAFDAALAALFASCVAEPVLASLGGGGFLLARSVDRKPILYDFFAHTPRQKTPESAVDFFPILADFGAAQQEFHIGLGSIATPGVIKGASIIQRDLCRMPLRTIIEPACEAARNGVEINDFQHYISEIVSPIIESSPEALQLHTSCRDPHRIAGSGEIVRQPDMADTFESLADEGEGLFYRGEMGRVLVDACRHQGGYLQAEDLVRYQAVRRQPLELDYQGSRLFTNPPPSVGGTLIAFALSLLEPENLSRFAVGSFDQLARIAQAQKVTQMVREQKTVDQDLTERKCREVLSGALASKVQEVFKAHPVFSKGTTQVSIADAQGNLASMTLSNGEGSGYVLPGTGIMLNNMLGEEDINPHGFHQWPENRRIASMMSPTLVSSSRGGIIATGSGGSNRIRSAILQVLINLLDHEMDVMQAVEQARIHYESGVLNLEHGSGEAGIDRLLESFPSHRLWPQKNLFFGGAHSVLLDRDGVVSGQGDSRRGGVCLYA